MIKPLLILLPFAVRAFALGQVVLTDQTGSAQVNRPNMVFRTFQKGDIPHYAQAVIGGTPVTTQCDVMTRWPDNSVKQAMVSFVYTVPASSALTVDFQDQATGNNTGYLTKTDLLARSWDAQIQTLTSSITKIADARTILNGASSISTDPNSLGVRYWYKGSLMTQIILEDRSSSRANDFGYTCLTNCTTGIQSVANISTVDGTFTASGHTLQNGALVRIHIFGQVGFVPAGFTNDTNYYVVNRATNTFQLSASSGGSPIVPTTVGSTPNELFWPLEISGEVTGSATWGSDSKYKSLHPIFVLTFFAGYSGVKVDYILTNDWTTALQDQRYALTLLGDSGNSTTKLSKSEFLNYSQTRWRYTYWSGTPVGDVKIDHGFTYLTGTGIVPNYDPAGTVTASDISSGVDTGAGKLIWASSDKCDPTVSGSGWYIKGFGTTGQTTSDWIGLLSAWEARWLYGMSNASVTTADFAPIVGNTQCSANAPIHLRESATSRWYDSGHTVDAYGLPVSIDARPSMYYMYRVPGSDDITFLHTRSTSHGWNGTSGILDTSHEPPFAYFAYTMTGDWFALQELYAWAAYNAAQHPQTNGSANTGRSRIGLPWEYRNDMSEQARGMAWDLRTLLQAAAAAPDSSPEKAHFVEKVNYNIKIGEGRYGITAGTFPPANASCPGYDATTTTDPWCWGNQTISQQWPNDGVPRVSPMGGLISGHTGGCIGDPDYDQTVSNLSSAVCDQMWQNSFVYGVFGMGKDFGFGFDPILQYGAKLYVHLYLDPTYNPYLVESKVYVSVETAGVAIQRLGTPSNLAANIFYMTYPARSTWRNTSPGASGYANISRAAVSWATGYTIDGLIGANAWAWASTNTLDSGAAGNPKWLISPRAKVTVGSACDLNKDNMVDILDVQSAVNQAIGLTPCGSADLDKNGTCDVVDVQRVVNAALGGACVTGQ
jgi:hypothetical protein